jgi:hypothetical protein
MTETLVHFHSSGVRSTVRSLAQAGPWRAFSRRSGRTWSQARPRPGSRWASRPTAGRGYRRWWRPGMRCSRSTRCRRPGTGNGTPPRGQVRRRRRARAGRDRPVGPRAPPAGRRGQPGRGGDEAGRRTHQTLVWDRSRQLLRLRSALREFFPAALEAFDDLAAPDVLELLGRAPDPDRAARLSRSAIAAELRRSRRRDVEAKAERIQGVLRAPALHQSPDGDLGGRHAPAATYFGDVVRLYWPYAPPRQCGRRAR